MPITFEDYRVRVKIALDDAVTAFLYEAGGEFKTKIRRNSRTDTSKTRDSYDYIVNELKGECIIGSPDENAIWEEFGTGEHALKGNGRKGGWVYKSEKDGKFYFTVGKTPNRPMYRAYEALKKKVERQLSKILKDKMGG